MGSTSPWWFAATLGFIGVLVGAFAKWRLDLLLDRNKRAQDQAMALREKKESLYLELLTLFDRVALARINANGSKGPRGADGGSRYLEAAEIDLAAANKIMTSLSFFDVPEVRRLAEECLRLLVSDSRLEYERRELELSAAIRRDLGLAVLAVENLPEIPKDGWPALRDSGISSSNVIYNVASIGGSEVIRRAKEIDQSTDGSRAGKENSP